MLKANLHIIIFYSSQVIINISFQLETITISLKCAVSENVFSHYSDDFSYQYFHYTSNFHTYISVETINRTFQTVHKIWSLQFFNLISAGLSVPSNLGSKPSCRWKSYRRYVITASVMINTWEKEELKSLYAFTNTEGYFIWIKVTNNYFDNINQSSI